MAPEIASMGTGVGSGKVGGAELSAQVCNDMHFERLHEQVFCLNPKMPSRHKHL